MHWQRSAQDAAEELEHTARLWVATPLKLQEMQLMRLASCMGRDFQYQELPDEVDVEVDSDWAQCPRTRRSTGGGLVFWAKYLLDSYCQQQHTMSLSSAGAEIHEVVNLLGPFTLSSFGT